MGGVPFARCPAPRSSFAQLPFCTPLLQAGAEAGGELHGQKGGEGTCSPPLPICTHLPPRWAHGKHRTCRQGWGFTWANGGMGRTCPGGGGMQGSAAQKKKRREGVRMRTLFAVHPPRHSPFGCKNLALGKGVAPCARGKQGGVNGGLVKSRRSAARQTGGGVCKRGLAHPSPRLGAAFARKGEGV